MMKQLRRTIETVAHLRPSQIAARLWFRVYKPRPRLTPAPEINLPKRNWVEGPGRHASLISADRLRFLNVEADISSPGIWQDRSRGDLWTYNLHYFDDLVAVGALDRRNWHLPLIHRWISENPPGQGAGWEPYPLSLRVVNWIKWHIATGALPSEALDSLAVQVRYLREQLEYHILGNHLLANAKAIYFAGLFFGGDEGRSWLRFGSNLMTRQVREQVLADGAHFELSPMYHLIVAEDLLDCINAAQVFDADLPLGLEDATSRMLAWAEIMEHPDQKFPFFNDAAFDVAPIRTDLTEYATRLGVASAESPSTELMARSAGYIRFDAGPARVFLDVAAVGPAYQPGHAHADSLSFELSVRGQRIFVNSGTSIYGRGAERLRQRGTAAHNCLVVDGQNSSDVWSGFRVGRRARIRDRQIKQENGVTTITAQHDGYSNLGGRPIHRRTWSIRPDGLRINDEVLGEGRHKIELYFHLHPQLDVAMQGEAIALALPEGHSLRVQTSDGLRLQVVEGTWHPNFGVGMPSKMLRATVLATLPWFSSVDIAWDS